MSDPGALAANLLQKNFPKFGTFRKLCTYKDVADPIHDPSTDEVTPVTNSSTQIYIIFDEFNFTLTQAAIMQGDESNIISVDRKAIFPALDLPVVPKVHDLIVEGSTTWRVMGLSRDPKPAHHELHVRPING
jgi:hypothetical protein